MLGAFVVIFLLGIVCIIVTVIGLIVSKIRKNARFKWKRAVLVSIVIIVVGFIGVCASPDDDTTESANTTTEESSNKKSTKNNNKKSNSSDEDEDSNSMKSSQNSNSDTLVKQLVDLGYTKDEAKAIRKIFRNVGILDADEMWVLTDNDPLKACALEYNDHQVNFTTEDNVLFYVQITGWEKEISKYGWYRSKWSGKLKYGYNTQTQKTSVDLYSVDSDGSGGYEAYYDVENDSVMPYDEKE